MEAATITIEDSVEQQRNRLKTDRLDMSFGELMNIYQDDELIITPEYQRAFRWSPYQQTRFIESILLGIPIPPIFVAADKENNWELVDGLQRISTIFAFFGILKSEDKKNNTILQEGDLIKELKNLSINDLPIKLKTLLRRAVCRVEIVQSDSNEDIRYELFNRLNTGASPLSQQEIRNCIFRSSDTYPIDINSALRDLSKNSNFIDLIQPTEKKQEEMFLESLVLRFFALKNSKEKIVSDVEQYFTDFMKEASKGKKDFVIETEKQYFVEFVEFLYASFGKEIFRPNGVFTLHIFDSLSYAIPRVFETISGNEQKIQRRIEKFLSDDEYKEIGTSTYSYKRMNLRMARALKVFENA